VALILIADQELAALAAADRVGTSGQHEVAVAASGEQLLVLAGRRRPHLVVLPLALPDMPAERCCRRLRALPGLRGTTVVVTARQPTPELTRRCLAAGCDRLVEAPVSREAFYGLLKGVVPGRTQSTRVALDAAVRLDDGRVVRARNISRSGMRLDLDAPLPPGTPLRIELQLPRFQSPLRLTAFVVWSRQEPGGGPAATGVRFTNVDALDQRILDMFIMTAKTALQL
jgi:CheY-like chemotaxis protein